MVGAVSVIHLIKCFFTLQLSLSTHQTERACVRLFARLRASWLNKCHVIIVQSIFFHFWLRRYEAIKEGELRSILKRGGGLTPLETIHGGKDFYFLSTIGPVDGNGLGSWQTVSTSNSLAGPLKRLSARLLGVPLRSAHKEGSRRKRCLLWWPALTW